MKQFLTTSAIILTLLLARRIVAEPVARLKPNAWGLFDMLGNVWEWCGDRHADEKTGELRDPVMRGGSWRSGAFHCTAVAHDPGAPQTRSDNIGFRVACRIEDK